MGCARAVGTGARVGCALHGRMARGSRICLASPRPCVPASVPYAHACTSYSSRQSAAVRPILAGRLPSAIDNNVTLGTKELGKTHPALISYTYWYSTSTYTYTSRVPGRQGTAGEVDLGPGKVVGSTWVTFSVVSTQYSTGEVGSARRGARVEE